VVRGDEGAAPVLAGALGDALAGAQAGAAAGDGMDGP